MFGLVLDASVARGLARDVDRVLTVQADGVVKAIIAFREAEGAAVGSSAGNWRSAPAGTFFGAIHQGQLPDLLRRWAKKTEALTQDQPVRLLSRHGQPLVASPPFEALGIPVTPAAVAQAAAHHTVYETIRRPGQRLRVVTRPAIEHGRVLFLTQLVASLNTVDASVRRFRLLLIVLIPVTLALASSTGWFLATTALKPVDAMVTQVQQISAQHLEARVPVPDTDDELERLAVTFNDMLTRLERGFRQLRQFSAAASHELRTPLTAIKGELEVALRKPRAPEEYQRVLHEQLEIVDEMAATVEELLLLSYSEAADRTVEWNPVDLAALATHAGTSWQTRAGEQSVRVTVSAQEPIWVLGERRLLERLLANLVDNALKHTPAGGRVMVAVDTRGDRARLVVQDTGPGIAPEDLPQLFDRFFTPHRPTPGDHSHSTGLGLGLCRWIAEVHRGQIEIASPPGQGATVTVQLPLIP